MGTTREQSMEIRLQQAGRRIDEIADRAMSAQQGAKVRLGRRVDALRAKEAAARTRVREVAEAEAEAWDESLVELDHELDELDIELAIAEAQLEADLAEDAAAFEAAVQRQIDAYNSYAEHLQALAATAKQTAHNTLEGLVRSMRERRAAATERLKQYRAASSEASEALKAGLYDALDDLDRAVEEARSKYE